MHSPQEPSPSVIVQPTAKHMSTSISMDNFIKTQLLPVDECIVCTEPFSATHKPVALNCKHIFGHECIERWIRSGRGNKASCPVCRHVLVERKNARPAFDTHSLWRRLCELPPDCLHGFMSWLWKGIRELWQRKPDGKFKTTDILEKVIFPALITTGAQAWSGSHDALTDAYNLIAASWDSLERPNRADGLAIPLVRLTRLMVSASQVTKRWLTSLRQVNELFWKANECLGLTEECISWDVINDAANLESDRYFPLLHLYTMLISHGLEMNPEPENMPTRRHEIMNLVIERCCKKIGSECYAGRPSNSFKDSLLVVFQELRRYQLGKNRWSLKGHNGEVAIVKGLWALGGWVVKEPYKSI